MGRLITIGKTKLIVDAGNGNVFIKSKDDITAGDGARHDVIEGKAIYSTWATRNAFKLLERNGVRTHYVDSVDDTTFLARELEMIPVELVVRHVAPPGSSYLKRNPDVKEGTVFEALVFEMFEKNDAMHDPKLEFDFVLGTVRRYVADKPRGEALIDETLLADSIVYAKFTPELVQQLQDISLNTFSILAQSWDELGGMLLDFKIECGRDRKTGELMVGDVIDPESCRIVFGGEQKDKQAYRDGTKSLPDIKKDYMEVAIATDGFNTVN
jgi:phosphoribosylaminoimidazole-succinocarboxamide synthase